MPTHTLMPVHEMMGFYNCDSITQVVKRKYIATVDEDFA